MIEEKVRRVVNNIKVDYPLSVFDWEFRVLPVSCGVRVQIILFSVLHRETGEKTAVQSSGLFFWTWCNLSDEEIEMLLFANAEGIMKHELGESWKFSGKRSHDPHEPPNRTLLPFYGGWTWGTQEDF